MATRHWIITNREVRRKKVGDHFVERVEEDNWKEALPVFRVAQIDLNGLSSNSPRADLVSATTFIEDSFIDDAEYASLNSAADPTRFAGSKRLFLSLYNRMREAPRPKGDVLFYIHGFNYSWTDALKELARLHEVYVEPDESPIDQILLFSWPSHGSKGRYESDQAIAHPSGQLLGRVFGKAVAYHEARFSGDDADPFCGQQIHIAAHSMGNQVLQEFLRTTNDLRHLRRSIFGQALLLNADADWSALESPRPLGELHEYARRTHVYTHASDDALSISEQTKNDEKRLGKHGPRDPRLIPPRTILLDTSDLRAKPDTIPDSDPMLEVARSVLDYAEVSVKERMFDHWGWLNRAEVIADVYRVLSGVSSSEMEEHREYKGEKRYKLRPR